MDAVAVARIKEYQAKLTEFLTTSRPDVLEQIGQKKAIDEALTADLKTAADQFAQLWT